MLYKVCDQDSIRIIYILDVLDK